jgi:sigma-B regulation protein RsbU (phosphoserine phosphatase)
MYEERTFASRSNDRRRAFEPVQFPLVLDDGTRIDAERRASADRRNARDPAQLHLFHGLEQAALEALLADCPVRHFQGETVVLRPGEPNRHMFLLLSGWVRIHLDSADSPNGWKVGKGACVGELSMIDGKPASAFAVAEPGCQLLAIDQETFWARVVPHPQVARNLMGVLSERMRQNNDAVLLGLRKQLQLELVQKELAVAREIQENMLPRSFPGHADGVPIDAAALMTPAREVGGDLYDLFHMSDGRICFVVGDVSDKGLPAALFMARTLDIVRVVTRLLPATTDPAERVARIMACVNEELCQNNGTAMFVTLLVGMLDPASGAVHLCSAGHPCPYVLAAGSNHPAMLDIAPGVPLGIVPGRQWSVEDTRLERGDVLVAYTDGVTEALDEAGEFYGEARFEALLAGIVDREPSQVIGAIAAGVKAYAGNAPAADDTTLLALRRT